MRLLLPAFLNIIVKNQQVILNKTNTRSIRKSYMGVLQSLISKPTIVDMAGEQAAFVQDLLANNKVVIFSKTYCPYCHMAKEKFEKLNVPAYVVELDERDDGDIIQDVLGEITGSRTVPRCFINGKFIGGGTEVKKMYETGALQAYFS